MKEEIAAPFTTAVLTFLVFTCIYLLGKLRDAFSFRRIRQRKGYAPIREAAEDFYQRRMFNRLRDCWNRPIASAPGPWIDVMERTDLSHTGGSTPLELLGTTKHCLNLGSYNYLGFAAHDPYCTPRVQDTMHQLGISTCSPRAIAGTTPAHLELEQLVAEFVGKEAAITFSMGFLTNTATIPALVGKGCLILSDQLNHASIVAGARATGSKIKVFKHNNPEHLEAVLRDSIATGQPRSHRPWRKILIIVEGIYSMEGEVCCLKEIVEIKKKYGAYLFLDEAHSIGALGKRGRGACEYCGVDPQDVDIMMGTFTKSFGSCGGYIAASRPIIDYLLRNSPAHLYATAMSPGSVQQVVSAMKLLMGHDGTNRGLEKIRHLHRNANYFRRRLLDLGLHVLGDWDSPVMPLMIYHPAKLPAFSRLCLRRGMAMVVVGFPATALLLTRARVCISASHTPEDLDYALTVLNEVAEVCMMKYARTKPLPEPRPHATQPENVPRSGITDMAELEAQQLAARGGGRQGRAGAASGQAVGGPRTPVKNGRQNGVHAVSGSAAAELSPVPEPSSAGKKAKSASKKAQNGKH